MLTECLNEAVTLHCRQQKGALDDTRQNWSSIAKNNASYFIKDKFHNAWRPKYFKMYLKPLKICIFGGP